MENLIIPIALGLLISILGVVNMTGNISTLHYYHRKRVTEENRKPFGRLVGLGTLIVGVSIITFGLLSFISEQVQSLPLLVTGIVILIIGIVAGLGLSFFAMIKYNKGIF